MLDLARAATGDKFVIIASLAEMLLRWDSSKFTLAMTSLLHIW